MHCYCGRWKTIYVEILPVTALSATEKILKELITYTQRFVSLRVVLLDRGFYSNEVIQQIKKADVKFVMPLKKYPKIKEQMQTVIQE